MSLATAELREAAHAELRALRLATLTTPHESVAGHPDGEGAPHVVQLLEAMSGGGWMYLVTPFVDGGDMFTLLSTRWPRGLEVPVARRCLRQIARGLLYLKARGLAHG